MHNFIVILNNPGDLSEVNKIQRILQYNGILSNSDWNIHMIEDNKIRPIRYASTGYDANIEAVTYDLFSIDYNISSNTKYTMDQLMNGQIPDIRLPPLEEAKDDSIIHLNILD